MKESTLMSDEELDRERSLQHEAAILPAHVRDAARGGLGLARLAAWPRLAFLS